MKNNHPLICDMETGVCGVSENAEMEIIDLTQPKKTIDLYYVTDPICSHCWALEPVLRRFIEQYGHYFNVRTVMGGLLEKWSGFADVSNGISKPADVAGHWQEVGRLTRMPIDGTLWYEDPVQSSYPPSRVFKVIQQQSADLAHVFLRRAREALFAFNRNIGDISVLVELVRSLGLDGEHIVNEAEGPVGRRLLQEDFALAAQLGVRGFPTIILVNEEKKGVKIVGSRPLDAYVEGLKQVLSSDEPVPRPLPPLSRLLEKERLLFSKEIEVMYDVDRNGVGEFINKELPQGSFKTKEILGETYIEK